MIIKHIPEDFIVSEVPIRDWSTDGEFSVFKLSKRDINTEHAVEIISRRFNIPLNVIKYSGTKDRHAKTIQYISIPKKYFSKHISLNENNIILEHVGYNFEPLSLGTLKGNNFEIILRELNNNELDNLSKLKKSNKLKYVVPNYFDEQRFSKHNYNIGLSIILGKYKDAVDIICSSSESFAEKTQNYLSKNTNDYVGALRNIPKKILLLFIHSVQSQIYNESLSRTLIDYANKNNIKFNEVEYSIGKFVYYDLNHINEYNNIISEISLVGFNTDLNKIDKYSKEVFLETGLNPRNFIIRAIPDLSVEGTFRNSFVEVENLEIELLDENNCKLKFFLGKGSYATIAIKSLI